MKIRLCGWNLNIEITLHWRRKYMNFMPRICHQLLDGREKSQIILCIHKNLYKESMKVT
jgi:hypothetical protein